MTRLYINVVKLSKPNGCKTPRVSKDPGLESEVIA
jgi:hypothetical protein